MLSQRKIPMIATPLHLESTRRHIWVGLGRRFQKPREDKDYLSSPSDGLDVQRREGELGCLLVRHHSSVRVPVPGGAAILY